MAATDLQPSQRLPVLTIDFANTFCSIEEIVIEYVIFYFLQPKHDCLV